MRYHLTAEPYRLHVGHHRPAIAVRYGVLPMIGKLLGHSKIQTTARYAPLARDAVLRNPRPGSPPVSERIYCPEAPGRMSA